jgi:hypothetical protein
MDCRYSKCGSENASKVLVASVIVSKVPVTDLRSIIASSDSSFLKHQRQKKNKKTASNSLNQGIKKHTHDLSEDMAIFLGFGVCVQHRLV